MKKFRCFSIVIVIFFGCTQPQYRSNKLSDASDHQPFSPSPSGDPVTTKEQAEEQLRIELASQRLENARTNEAICLRSGKTDACRRAADYFLQAEQRSKALNLYQKACLRNDSEGCRSAGIMQNAAEKTKEGEQLLKKSCRLQNELACDELREIKTSKTFEALTTACDRGKARSCVGLATELSKKHRLEEAFKSLERACELGDVPSCKSLGFASFKAEAFDAAFGYLSSSCSRGDAQSCDYAIKIKALAAEIEAHRKAVDIQRARLDQERRTQEKLTFESAQRTRMMQHQQFQEGMDLLQNLFAPKSKNKRKCTTHGYGGGLATTECQDSEN